VKTPPPETLPEPKVYRAPLDQFGDDPQNANRGTKRGKEALDRSIAELGAGRSLVADRNGLIPAGNKTRAALQRAGMREAIVVETDGLTPVIVKRTDWDLTDPAGPARRYALADNRIAELDLDFDPAILAKHLADGIDLSSLWSESELRGILGKDAFAKDGDDDVPEKPKTPMSQPGDLWLLGPHRLLCGSSVVEADVLRARGPLEPWIMVTDPPYGVNYDPDWRKSLGPVLRAGKVADWTEAWRLFPGNVAYVWHGALHAAVVALNLQAVGFTVMAQVIWRKPRAPISRGAYHWGHGPCWYAVRDGKTARWSGDRKQSTIWDMAIAGDPGAGEDDTPHGTQKPLEAMMRPIINHGARGDVVYEPFCGSGTTVIAAERANRVCVAVEIDAAYVDVIVERWQNATGGKATLGPDSPSLAGKAKAKKSAKR
jgi:DNA modification methylase